jgi:hypothetical protein
MTYQHGVNETRVISAPYAYNKYLLNTYAVKIKLKNVVLVLVHENN